MACPKAIRGRCLARSAPRAQRPPRATRRPLHVEHVGEVHVHIAGLGDHRQEAGDRDAPIAARQVCGPVMIRAAHPRPPAVSTTTESRSAPNPSNRATDHPRTSASTAKPPSRRRSAGAPPSRSARARVIVGEDGGSCSNHSSADLNPGVASRDAARQRARCDAISAQSGRRRRHR